MLTSQLFSTEIHDHKFNIRVLEMANSYFIYIGPAEGEILDGFAMAMKMPTNEVVKTTILETRDSTAEDIAFKITKKIGKPVYLSCCGIEDRLVVQPEIVNFLFKEVIPKLRT